MSKIEKIKYKGKRAQEGRMLPFCSVNYILFGIGIIVIIIGFIALSQGPWNSVSSLTIAPILLAIGYIIVVPSAILYKKKNIKKESEIKKEE